MDAPRPLPMFPLGTVLFPHALLPLRVFEPRYRLMTRRVLDGDGEFGVVLIERGSEVGGGDSRFGVGTVARVVRAVPLPDGGYALATVGTRRIRVERWLADDPYPHAEVADLADAPAPGADSLRDLAVAALEAVSALHRRLDPRLGPVPEIAAAPEQASFELAALAPVGPLDAQRLLEADSPASRLRLLADLLAEHEQLLRSDPRLG